MANTIQNNMKLSFKQKTRASLHSTIPRQFEKVEWNKLARAEIKAEICAGSEKKITEK